jgi:hypothetical protein
MSEEQPVFRGVVENFDSLPLETPLEGLKTLVCEYYTTAFGGAAKAAEDAGDIQLAAVYRFLNVLSSFYLAFGDPAKPYRPMWIMEDKRSLMPSDLLPSDYGAIKELAKLVKDSSLRARIYDVLWLEEHNHLDCREAAKSYLDSALALDTEENWTFAVTQFNRGLSLASKLGRKQEGFQRIAAALIAAIERDKDTEEGFRTCQLLQLASEFGCGEFSELAAIADRIGNRASDNGEHRRARKYWRLTADFRRFDKDKAGAAEATLRSAETYVAEAIERATGKMASYLAAASILKKGVESLRQAKASPERIQELRVLLAEYQKKSLSEMTTFETGMDLTEMAASAQKFVKGRTLFDALHIFSLGYNLTDVAELRAQVIKNANEFPMQHLFGSGMLDDEGRSVIERPGLFNLEGPQAEKELEAEMLSFAAKGAWRVRVTGFIHPARLQIFNEHRLDLRDLAFLVRSNPFVPPGHEGIFLRGIHAGFHGDFLVAAHLLVPQIENSIRFVLSLNGVDVSNLLADGTQPLKILGPLFDVPETKEIFGESLWFELRGLLIEKSGYDFRNQLAHGFTTEAECYGDAAVNLWWLILRLCLIPVLQRLEGGASGTPESGSRDDQNGK